jgi:hypothetical protein
MVDVYEMLRQKEDDIVRVRKEIQALRFVAPMLFEADDPQVLQPDGDSGNVTFSIESVTASIESNDVAMELPPEDEVSPEPVGVSQAIPPRRSRLRNLLGLAAGE